ncbi:MAG: hypothetical protein COT14_02165 [Candidatus Diapherotrites archaeon CG08_land_8_20_14_0_20_30_16]|nr:MAG: hypothetical protein COT14_02165 [Candidatus Diapherotrites archaeon CG08_land_8_20_14_0_20_30_16]
MNYTLLIPFSEATKKKVEEMKIDLKNPNAEQIALVRNLLINLFKGQFEIPDVEQKFIEDYFVFYPFVRIILSHTNKDRFYDSFSKFYYGAVKKELKEPKEALDLLKIEYKIVGDRCLIPFEIYIKAKIFSEKDKLTNQALKNGFVYLNKDKTVGFVARFIASRVIEGLPLKVSEISPIFKKIANEIDDMFKPKQPKYNLKIGKARFENFPPCMSRILSTMLEHGNPSHMERYYFATFNFTIKMDFESVLNLFKNTGDFNEKIAKYQLEKIQKYPCSNCDTLKSMGLCFPDDFCSNIKGPVGYYIKKTYKKI